METLSHWLLIAAILIVLDAAAIAVFYFFKLPTKANVIKLRKQVSLQSGTCFSVKMYVLK